MKVRGKITIVGFSTVLSVLLIIGVLLGQEKAPQEPYRPLAVLSEVLARIQSDYVEDPNFSKVTEGALHGLLESLDPYSSYLTPAEYTEYQKKRPGEASPGMIVSKKFGFVNIVNVLPNGPAQKASLQPGDIIESIDRKSTRDMALAEVISALEGPVGSKVTLSIVRERATEPKPVELIRAVVGLPDVSGRLMESGIGYVRVEAFPKGVTQKIAAKIQDLRKNGARKFILDLRDNAAGEIEEGASTANLFISRGLIGYVEGQQYPRRSFLADSTKTIAQEPLSVLVNSFTGGAAEIVASAVMENNRGDVIGEKSYGIGSIQKVIPLDDGSALILSIAKYFTPGGKEIQENGVSPNVPVEEDRDVVPLAGDESTAPETRKPREDAPLKKAIELLAAQETQPQAA